MKFEVDISEEDLRGYLKSIIRDTMKASIAQRFGQMMNSYYVEQEVRDQIYKQIKKHSEELVPQLLKDKARMDEVAQEAVTKHMMAKIKRNIKKMEGS